MDDQAYAYLKRLVATKLNIDLEAYKGRQMRRRLEAFVESRAGGRPIVFLRRLSEDPAMLEELSDMLTINVTEFFRDASHWETLEHQLLPELLKSCMRPKIWSAGCSFGHEPYSVAIMLDELGGWRRSSLVATDIDREALLRARAGGPYPPGELRNVSPARLERYFTESDGRYAVCRELVARVKFREVNLLADRFESGFDLVICRNVVIYFAVDAKARLVRRFRDALNPGGLLFIGATEALLGDEADGFERIGGNFYRKLPDVASDARAAGRAA